MGGWCGCEDEEVTNIKWEVVRWDPVFRGTGRGGNLKINNKMTRDPVGFRKTTRRTRAVGTREDDGHVDNTEDMLLPLRDCHRHMDQVPDEWGTSGLVLQRVSGVPGGGRDPGDK